MNLNTQIKKNAISFDIDFENIKQNTLTTKHDNKQPKKERIESIHFHKKSQS